MNRPRLRVQRPLAALVRAALCVASLSGCVEQPARSQPEDETRRVAPLPACVLRLPPRGAQSEGTVRRLREEEIVKLIFPRFDASGRLLPQGAATCTGDALFDDPLLVGGTPIRRGWPWLEEDGDILYGAGGDRIKVIWLRVLSFPDGTVGGPLAILRGTEQFAELFALGAYRASPDRVALGTARMGSDLLVTAERDGCTDRVKGSPCEALLSVFLPRLGTLRRVVDAPTERVAYGPPEDRGSTGDLQYRLTSTADYRPDGVHLLEQIVVGDEGGSVLRKTERERVFMMNQAETLVASVPPLWDSTVKLEKRRDPSPRTARRP
ncbi:MAG: hypothetical protein ACLQVI_02000 [Polyangiaceae bacterium]